MSDVLQYAGRTTDILAFEGAKAFGSALLDQTLALEGEGGKVCAGIQKLAQRFLIELFTERGTLTYQPTRGTDFMTRAKQGSLRTSQDVLAAFSAALVDVRRNLQAEESEDEPDDERYQDANILSVFTQPGEIKISLEVFSLAGSSRKVIFPISVVP